MALIVTAHYMTKAEALGLPGFGDDSLRFIGDEFGKGEITIFVPPAVAKATAEAFNKAMQEHLEATQ